MELEFALTPIVGLPRGRTDAWMITVSPELLAYMRMLPRLLVIAAVSAAFVLPAASFVRKAEQAVKKSDADATPLSPAQKLLQPVQLAAAVGLLVELPCCACGRPALGWRLSSEYFAFFAVGTLPRSYRFGKCAPFSVLGTTAERADLDFFAQVLGARR